MAMTFQQWSTANKEAGGTGSKYGYEQHMKSIGQPIEEDKGRQGRVDFARQNIDSTISEEDWKNNDYAYNPDCPPNYPYNSDDGQGCAEKPQNSTQVVQDAGGNWGPKPGSEGVGSGGRGGRGGGPPPTPPQPTTFGKSLSYGANPMQNMLINQFNTGTQIGDPTTANIFGLGLDRAVGGEGASADAPQMAQSLSGGGLWRGAKETFGGFRADQTNTTPQPAVKQRRRRGRGGGRRQAPQAPSPQEIAAPPSAAPPLQSAAAANSPDVSSGSIWGTPQETDVHQMMKKKFGGASASGGYI